MALTAAEHQALIDAELTDFFEDNRDLYREMARAAFEFARQGVDAAGFDVRVDDVIKVFEPMLEIEPTLRDFLTDAKLRQKYWPKRFGNYVLDQLWEELRSDNDKPEA